MFGFLGVRHVVVLIEKVEEVEQVTIRKIVTNNVDAVVVMHHLSELSNVPVDWKVFENP